MNSKLKRNIFYFYLINLVIINNFLLFLVKMGFILKIEFLKKSIKIYLKYVFERPVFNSVMFYSKTSFFLPVTKTSLFLNFSYFIVVFFRKNFFSLSYFIKKKKVFGYVFCKFFLKK